jgi:hypothetical protein
MGCGIPHSIKQEDLSSKVPSYLKAADNSRLFRTVPLLDLRKNQLYQQRISRT